MIQAGFVTAYGSWPWSRQFPQDKLEWDDVRFLLGRDEVSCDCLLVAHRLPTSVLRVNVPAERMVFIALEPPDVK
jgi:hypothetical protein